MCFLLASSSAGVRAQIGVRAARTIPITCHHCSHWANNEVAGMDRLDVMRLFTRIVERHSFTAAAQDGQIPRSTATHAIQQLEARLGVRLLERTTRQVRPTLDGEAYHQRCLSLIADLEEAEAAFGGARPKGLLRVDVHGTLARHFVMPRLPDFLAEYPGIELYMSEGDRLVDLIH